LRNAFIKDDLHPARNVSNGLRTFSREVEHRLNLLARDVEVFKHFFDGRGFQILENRRDWNACPAKHPCAADLAGAQAASRC
jgi:hypothetical protein